MFKKSLAAAVMIATMSGSAYAHEKADVSSSVEIGVLTCKA